MKRQTADLTNDEQLSLAAMFEEVAPRVLPAKWTRGDVYINAAWYFSRTGLRTCLEVEYQDGELWIHASTSRADRTPSYEEMREVKRIFFGDERKAIMVFPPKNQHYNYHPYCLHLFGPLARDPLPDFRTAGGQL